MPRRRSSGEIAQRIERGPYVPRGPRRTPCSRCHVFAPREALVIPLEGPTAGRFCEACWPSVAESYAPREAGGETLDRYYQRTYGIGLQEYGERFLRQQGACAICKSHATAEEPLAVDHDHDTGFVRGLLCRTCNVGLGCFKDNVAHMGRAIAYLVETK